MAFACSSVARMETILSEAAAERGAGSRPRGGKTPDETIFRDTVGKHRVHPERPIFLAAKGRPRTPDICNPMWSDAVHDGCAIPRPGYTKTNAP